jgi:hypothetical protein
MSTLPPPRIDLVALDEDIHHIILTELVRTSPTSLLSIARVCKALNAVATPYIYRTLVLGTQAGSQLLLERLRGEEGSVIAKRVWHVRIEEVVGVEDLMKLLEGIGNLKTFRLVFVTAVFRFELRVC